ncbi:MAG: hypothetical protein GX868_18505 [Actinobacteria bacterium]|nr:hypothetical protein [Actinomycetota bacterium]
MSQWDTPVDDSPKRSQSISPGVIGGLIALVVLVIFIAQNNDKAVVEFLFWSFEVSLWFGLILAAALTLLAERLIAWGLRRRKRGQER